MTASNRTGAEMSLSGPAPRIPAIDIARTVAILGMATFHFARDLEIFGQLPPGTTLYGPWAWFARGVAGTFLFLAGVSLVLAHGQGIRWRAFARRLGIIVAAALLVSVATFVAMRDTYVYFGILHAIAASSVLALLFLRAPPWLTAGAAVAIWALAFAYGRSLFDAPIWGWTGFSITVRPSIDFVPLVPWLAPCLLGVACARWALAAGWLSPRTPGRGLRVLAWPGRHSLVIYLVHQPVLVALVWSWLRFIG